MSAAGSTRLSVMTSQPVEPTRDGGVRRGIPHKSRTAGRAWGLLSLWEGAHYPLRQAMCHIRMAEILYLKKNR